MQNKKEAIQLFLDKTSYSKQQIHKIIKLNDGFTNVSYKITTKDGLMFQVRICDNKFINRKVEKLVFDNLKVPLVYFDNTTGNMIKRWVNGKCIKKWNYEKIDIFVDKIKKFHSMPINNIPKFNAYSFIELLSKSEFDNNVYTRYIALLNKYPSEYNVPCHCDLNPKNIIYDKKTSTMSIIDYEWTRMNSVYFELANLARESMNKKQIIYLAHQYGNIDLNKLKDFLIIACLYAYQWSLSVPSNSKIKKYQKNILRRLYFCENLNFDDYEFVLSKIKMKTLYSDNYSKSKVKSENNDEKFIDVEHDEKTSLIGIQVDVNNINDEQQKHNCSCKIKGRRKDHKSDKVDDFISDQEFQEKELELQEKIVSFLDQKNNEEINKKSDNS